MFVDILDAMNNGRMDKMEEAVAQGQLVKIELPYPNLEMYSDDSPLEYFDAMEQLFNQKGIEYVHWFDGTPVEPWTESRYVIHMWAIGDQPDQFWFSDAMDAIMFKLQYAG